MSSIDHFDLRSFDLNLLVAFDALMQQQTVTGAAARLKVGQPAMSHSLATLRVLLQDELFVRVGQTMRPTARARTLAPRIRTALEQMQAALHLSDAFDPLTEQRTFRLGFSSEMELLLIPDLTERLRVAAPGLRLLGSLVERDKVHAMIDDGAIDLAIGCFAHAAQRHCGEHLFDPTLSCCFNPRLLPLVAPIGLDAYLATPHAVVSRNDVLQGCLDAGLHKAGVQLNVVAAGSEFMTVLAAAARSPVLVTVPSRMARRFGPRFGLTVSDLPLALDIPSVEMVWSARSDCDPAAAWMRERVRACVADAEPEAGMKEYRTRASEQRSGHPFLEEARRAGLLDGEKSARFSFRAPQALVEAAKRRTGVTSTTELGLLALARLALCDPAVAVCDPAVAYMEQHRGALGADHDLDY